jgi:hypothetical protein
MRIWFHRVSRVMAWTLFLAVAGCGDPPTKEINQAQGAIDTARAAGAADYATEEFRAAETALASAHQAVEERDYRQALNFALDARDRAQTAASEAGDGKARARTEADRALRTAETSIERTRERLNAAMEAKVAPASLADAQRAIAAAETVIASARAAFDKGDYHGSLAALSDLQSRLEQTTSEINAAMDVRAPRRPSRRVS